MLLWAILLAVLALASPVHGAKQLAAGLPLSHRVVYQFPNHTWLENIFVRSNGDLLVTVLMPSAALIQISDPSSAEPTVSIVHNFTSVDGLLGIAETKHDVFTVTGGNFTGIGAQVNGTFSAWEVDLNGSDMYNNKNVNLITSMKPVAFMNGLTSLPENPTTVLIADSALGVVWRLDTLTGRFNKALDFLDMKVVPGSPLAIGINGIRISNDTLYFTNSFERTIYRVKIDKTGGVAMGAAMEKFVQIKEAIFLDDFAIGSDGVIWAVENVANRLFAVRPDGSYEVVEGGINQTTVAGDTAAAFGRGKTDQKTLYVVTSGAQAGPVNGTYVEGGKVVAVDTSGY
ncbi:hypothetical protein CONLIGDRAFT_389394 [Coniochaeta ligniaria NRRL 30616]|uniref:SMP-30/Gluconolactonase/LRE-like region domain-containing protein n=1 Tax=Coniochaeta ligniaria NRRL 30616 TaxID=1408157 RepID=A0A1J7J5S1_9PEZI|nr:hypothetical protein CONLIGDRAFT_389394 [Coniochaeta ligniaria NRRL 30616]